MPKPVWRYNKRLNCLICTAGGYDYCVSLKRWCFDHVYHHLCGKLWGTPDVMQQFYEIACDHAPEEWMRPNPSFKASITILSHCSCCNALVLIHDLSTCRYCGAKQPDDVRVKYERELIYEERIREFLDMHDSHLRGSAYMYTFADLDIAELEAEVSMILDGIPRLVEGVGCD